MITKVAKRPKNGKSELVDFDPTKIASAIYRAAQAVGGRDFDRSVELTKQVVNQLESLDKQIIAVEEIQDIVEKVLVKNGHYRTAKAYIIYRFQHAQIRSAEIVKSQEHINTYLGKNDLAVKENANMVFSLQGLNNYITEQVCKNYWLEHIYPEHVRNAFENGDFHIHDLGILAPYCVGWDLQDLLREGFRGVPGKVASKPAKHFKPALGQVVNFLYTLQGEAAGAQAFSNFDTLLAPFIRHDNLSYPEVKQAIQEFLFNMNVSTRVGFQNPFSNVTMDLKVPDYMKNEPVIIGGELMDSTYGEFQVEMDMLNKAFAEIMLEGDAEERVFTFPIPTYNITHDFDWDNPDYDGIWEMTAKYGTPYFANYINSDMNPEDTRSMCCRLRLDNTEIRKRMGGLFAAAPLTGSIGVVTINLPKIAYLATYSSNAKEEFFLRLGMIMDIAKDSLEIKRKTLEHWTEQKLYPYTRFYLRGVKEATGKYWTNHFSTIGLIGMHEACLNLLGEGIHTSNGRFFALDVMEFMLERVACYQEKTGNLYNLEATPAEGAAHKLALNDLKKFPDIITSGTEKAPYYTNSTQLPVGYYDDLFEALEHQEMFQALYTGGTVFHTFLGEKSPDIETTKRLIRNMCRQFKLPYFTITPTFSICPNHRYLDGEIYVCPTCDADCEVYSRVVGYLRPINQWNAGQRQQFYQRATFDGAVGRKKALVLRSG